MTEPPSRTSIWNEFASGVGHVAISAARLETAVTFLCQHLLASNYGAVVVTGLSWRQLRDTAEALIKAHPELAAVPHEQLDEIQASIKTADRLMIKRHRVVHSYWFAGQGNESIPLAHLARHFRPPIIERWTQHSLFALADEMDETTTTISQWISRRIN